MYNIACSKGILIVKIHCNYLFRYIFKIIYLTIFQNFNAVELFVSIFFHSFEAIMAMQKHYA